MMRTTLRACLGFAALFAATAQALEPPVEGYKVVELEWEVQTSPGGPTIFLNGTVQEVYAQLELVNPDFEAQFAAAAKPEVRGEARTDWNGCGYVCDRWEDARVTEIRVGIDYLRGIPGQPRNGPGHGCCSRVSCSWKSAIWWCNDDLNTKELTSFHSVADGAQAIMDRCVVPSNPAWVDGQIFHPTNWNVIIRKDTDNC